MTQGELTAVSLMVPTVVVPFVASWGMGVAGQTEAAGQLAIAFGIAATFWAIVWIGYAGGRAAQRKRGK